MSSEFTKLSTAELEIDNLWFSSPFTTTELAAHVTLRWAGRDERNSVLSTTVAVKLMGLVLSDVRLRTKTG